MSLKELRGSPGHKIWLGDDSYPERNTPKPDEFEFLTVNDTYWKLRRRFPLVSPIPKGLPDEEDLLNFQLAMSSRRTPIPEDLYNSHHSRAIQFFLQNWWKIRDIFIEPSEAPQTAPRCYAEVDLGELGRPDFVGVCRDGSIAVVEFGLSSKAPQVAVHAYGLSQFINSETMPVFPFTAKYSSSGKNSFQIDISQVNAGNITRERESEVRLITSKYDYVPKTAGLRL